MTPKFYVTTAIDYSNGNPHIGHAFEKVGTDCIARYHRLRGDTVHFLTGMDEHGQKVAQTAAQADLTPQQLVDRIAARFQATWRTLAIDYDQFIRTTDPAHQRGVVALIERIFARRPDDLYEHAYAGWYCVGCEMFKQESEIEDGKCILHPTRTLEWAEERNWFFRLSAYRDFLLRLHRDRPEFLEPDTRRNEVIRLLEQGLEDVSVSRGRLGWGIPFPRALSTGEEQTVWVWFDALPNYLTATGFPDEGWDQRWPAQLHVIGKDITRLHCVIWPAMLEAAGIPLPERVWAHGFVTFKGERLSKSAGVTLDLDEAIARHGPDAFRYFLLREVPFDADGSFTWERFDARYTAELADGFGNLVSRVVSMIGRYTDGLVPETPGTTELDREAVEVLASYRAAMDTQLLHEGAAAAFRLVARANGFVEKRAPWNLARARETKALRETLAALAEAVARIAILLSPFIPRKAQTVWEALGLEGKVSEVTLTRVAQPGTAGRHVTKLAPLFPKPEPTS
jgi:methionyl-tRNA synthetase